MLRQTSYQWIIVFLWALLYCRQIRASTASQQQDTSDPPFLPVPYPDSFCIAFVTNITRRGALRDDDDDDPILGKLCYDWSNQRQRSQRMDHAAGSFECQHFYQTNEACSLIFRPDGMYRLIHHHHHNGDRDTNTASPEDCCLDLPLVGTPPPDWAIRANPTYKGVVQDEFTGRLAHEWIFDQLSLDRHPPFLRGDGPCRREDGNLHWLMMMMMQHHDDSSSSANEFHSIRQVAQHDKNDDDDDDSSQSFFEPLLFTFPGKAAGRQDFHYLLDTLEIKPLQDSSLFELPTGCQGRLCKTPCTTALSQTANPRDRQAING